MLLLLIVAVILLAMLLAGPAEDRRHMLAIDVSPARPDDGRWLLSESR